MLFKNIIFDLDGTISDSRPGIYNALHYALEKMNVKVDDNYDLSGFIGPPIYDCFKEHFFKNDDDITKAIEWFRHYYSEKGWAENQLYDGIYDLVSWLYKQNCRLYIATNKPQIFTDKIAEHFRLIPFFEMIKGVDINKHQHSKAELIKEILESDEGILPENTVMIGDSKWDIFAADHYKIKTIAVLWGFGGSSKELESYGAYKIAGTVNELKNMLGK